MKWKLELYTHDADSRLVLPPLCEGIDGAARKRRTSAWLFAVWDIEAAADRAILPSGVPVDPTWKWAEGL